MSTTPPRFATRCAHAAAKRSGGGRNEPLQPAILQSAIFDPGGTHEAGAIFSGTRQGYDCSRFGNSSASNAPGGRMLTGLAASSGIARGTAFVCSCGDGIVVPRRPIEASAVDRELERLEQAVTGVEAELLAIREETRRRLGTESSAIFEAQACLLRDPELCDATTRRCRTEMINVEAALSDTVTTLSETFGKIDNSYVRERAADLRDIARRLLTRLMSLNGQRRPSFPVGSIVVTRELLPSFAADLDRASSLASSPKTADRPRTPSFSHARLAFRRYSTSKTPRAGFKPAIRSFSMRWPGDSSSGRHRMCNGNTSGTRRISRVIAPD